MIDVKNDIDKVLVYKAILNNDFLPIAIDKFVDEYHVVPNKINGANWLTSEYPIKKLLASGIDFDKNIQVKTNLVNKDNNTVTL